MGTGYSLPLVTAKHAHAFNSHYVEKSHLSPRSLRRGGGYVTETRPDRRSVGLGRLARGASIGQPPSGLEGLLEGLSSRATTYGTGRDILAPRTGASQGKLLHYEQVSEVNRRVCLSVTETLEEGRFPVILGGDHKYRRRQSIAAVSKRHSGNIGVIWIDARRLEQRGEHMHRQYARDALFPLSVVTGPDCMVEFGQEQRRLTWLTACRSADGTLTIWSGTYGASGVTVFPINMIDKLGMGAVIEAGHPDRRRGHRWHPPQLLMWMPSLRGCAGHGSDCLQRPDPREAFLAAEAIAESRKLISMDMVEVNPFLDTANKSGILASELIQSALEKAYIEHGGDLWRNLLEQTISARQPWGLFRGCFLGAGYVSGREMWQFFGRFGPVGWLGLCLSIAPLGGAGRFCLPWSGGPAGMSCPS